METFDIVVLSVLGVILLIGWIVWRPRKDQVQTWNKEANDGRGGWVPLLDEEGVGVIKTTLHNYELLLLTLTVLVATIYFTLLKVWTINQSFEEKIAYGVYHIIFGLIGPVVLGVSVIVGYKVGLSPGRVVKIEKPIPFTSEKETVYDKELKKDVETGKVRYKLDSEDPSGNDTETELVSVFENAERQICEATTFRKALNNEFVRWVVDKKYLGLFKGNTKVFNEIYSTETILAAHIQRFEDTKHGKTVYRQFLTWNAEPRFIKNFILGAYDEYDAMSRVVMAERERQSQYIILGLRNNEQVILSEREDFAQKRVALVLTQTSTAMSFELGLLDAKEITEAEFKLRQIQYLMSLDQVETGLPVSGEE